MATLNPTLEIVDLGAGYGSAALVLRDLLSQMPGQQVPTVRLHLIDNEPARLEAAHVTATACGFEATTHCVDLLDDAPDLPVAADVIIASQLLLHCAAPERVFAAMGACLKHGGSAVVVETDYQRAESDDETTAALLAGASATATSCVVISRFGGATWTGCPIPHRVDVLLSSGGGERSFPLRALSTAPHREALPRHPAEGRLTMPGFATIYTRTEV